jgi:hypothetical protein
MFTKSNKKNSDEIFANRLHQVVDRLSGPEDKIDELVHSDEDKRKKQKNMN